jgi:CPA2 family monovalent cation:H+ antiporter-2
MAEQSAIFVNFTILLVAALIGGIIAYRLKQPVILGYLIVGIIIGPHALGWVNDLSLVEASATIGVALLMLTLGLEVSFHQLRQVGKVGLLGGIIQIVATFAFGLLAALMIFHWSFVQSVLFGLIISLSSTTVCIKILMDRGELDSVHGRIMVAILILQDITAVFMIIIEPLLGQVEQNVALVLAKALGGIVLFIAIAFVTGLWILPRLMGRVGGVRSRELFLLTVLVLCLGAALGTQIFGLSAVFGAFLIGLVLRETRFAHQALAEITPLRDIFAAFFFVSLGMLLDPRFVINNWVLIISAVALIFAIKFITVSGIVRGFGFSWSVALMSGLGLFQIGEFSFIIAQGGINLKILSAESYALIIGSSIITILLTPFAMSLAGRLHSRLAILPSGSWRVDTAPLPFSEKPEILGEVIIAGFGRVGQNTAQGLQDAGIPFHIIEIDPEVVKQSKCGENVCTYGDASNLHVLTRVNLKNAKVMVITFPDPVAVLTTAKTALSINPELKVIARAHRTREADQLKKLGVSELISPEYEASLEFIRRILHITGLHKAEIKQTMNKVLEDHNVSEFEKDDEYEP